eukprot:gene1237-1561_t
MISNKGLSIQATKLLNKPRNPVLGFHFKALGDLYDPETNPNGCISVAIAENTICFDLLKNKLINEDPTIGQAKYSQIGGVPRFRNAIVKLLTTKLFKTNLEKVSAQNIVVGAGATAMLESLFFTICNPNDIVIIPSPMYSSFPADAGSRVGAKVVPAPCEVYDENQPGKIVSFKLQIETLESIYNENPGKVKCVLLCNPNNPTGHLLSVEEIQSVIDWCREKQIHLISDEIYALSVFNHEKAQFTSIFDICDGELGDFIHIVNGFSKDFGLNGLRAGYIYSDNRDLLNCVAGSPFHLCSNMVQSVLSNLIEDTEFLDYFIKENQKRLKDTYDFTVKELSKYNIPYIESYSGLFLVIDLRKYLKENTIEEETNLAITLFEKERIVLGPGSYYFFREFGYFRIVFSQDIRSVGEFLKRLGNFCNNQVHS